MKQRIALLLAAAAIFSSAGCSFVVQDTTGKALKDLEDKQGGLKGDDEAYGILVDGEFYAWETCLDLMRDFREFEYIWSSDNLECKFALQYLGEETVAGSPVKHFMLRTEENEVVNEYEFWASDNPAFDKVIYGGAEFTGADARWLAESAGLSMAVFFSYANLWGNAFVKEGGYGSAGWQLAGRSTATRSFGAGEVIVERFEFIYKLLSEEHTHSYEAAKIGGKYLFVSWSALINNQGVEMRVTKLIPR